MKAQVHQFPKPQLRTPPPPTAEMLGLANERTRRLQNIFVNKGMRVQDLARFAQACYVLGVHDTEEALQPAHSIDRAVDDILDLLGGDPKAGWPDL